NAGPRDRPSFPTRRSSDLHGYSGFEGVHDEHGELPEWLRRHGVDEVEVVGIATDHCVRATALDAARAGFDTKVRLELTAGVSKRSEEHTSELQSRENLVCR